MLDALRYPLSGDAPLRTFAVGVLLSSLGVLLLPAVLVAGYYGRVLASSSAGRGEPPRFEGWSALFVQGLKTWTVVAGYVLLGVLALLALGAGAFFLGGLDTGTGSLLGTLAILVALLLLLGLFAIPAWFFVPVALIRLARTDSIAAAFDVRAIAAVATDRRYLTRWLGGVAVLLVGSSVYALSGGLGGLLAGLLSPGAPASGLRIGGHVFGVAVNFYCQVAAFRCFGRGYAVAVGEPAADRREQTETAPEYDGWGAEARAWRERRHRDRNDGVR